MWRLGRPSSNSHSSGTSTRVYCILRRAADQGGGRSAALPRWDMEEVAGTRPDPSGVGERQSCSRHQPHQRAVMLPDCSFFLVSLSDLLSHQTAGAAEAHTNAMTTAQRRERDSREWRRPGRQLQVQMREWDGTIKADHGAFSSSPFS